MRREEKCARDGTRDESEDGGDQSSRDRGESRLELSCLGTAVPAAGMRARKGSTLWTTKREITVIVVQLGEFSSGRPRCANIWEPIDTFLSWQSQKPCLDQVPDVLDVLRPGSTAGDFLTDSQRSERGLRMKRSMTLCGCMSACLVHKGTSSTRSKLNISVGKGWSWYDDRLSAHERCSMRGTTEDLQTRTLLGWRRGGLRTVDGFLRTWMARPAV